MSDEEIPQPDIASYCRRCARTSPPPEEEHYGIVSPTGVAHVGGCCGDTACGIDATGKKWWWKL